MAHIALLMMIKNEEKRLHISLNSVVGFVQSMIIYDTGSTDSTLDIVKNFSETHNIPLHLKQGEFVDFSTSRNVALDYADTFMDVDFLLLLDCNDELQGGEALQIFCEEQLDNPDVSSYFINQQWYSGSYNNYYNVRLLKTRHYWRYRGVVHEYAQNLITPDIYTSFKAPLPICLYQDRTQDDDKSKRRFTRDKELLVAEYKRNPKDPRTVFYLAQTCACLGHVHEAYVYYKIRSTMGSFDEEIFHCHLRMGNIARDQMNANKDEDKNKVSKNSFKSMKWENALKHYMDAFEHSAMVEPILQIAKHYKDTGKWVQAYSFAKIACELNYPSDKVLFIDNNAYEYERYHIMGIVAYYAGKYHEGYDACIQAIKVRNEELDKSNLKFYQDKLEEDDINSQKHLQQASTS